MRTFRFSTIALLLVLVAAIAVPAHFLAQDNSANGAPTVLSFGISGAQPPRMMTAIGFTNASAGMQMNGFPCMGGTAGCADKTAGTIALPVPLAVVMRNSKVTYTFELEDVSYTGPCSLSYVLTIGTTKIDSGSYKFPAGCKPNTAQFCLFQPNIQDQHKNRRWRVERYPQGWMHTDTITQKFCFTKQPRY